MGQKVKRVSVPFLAGNREDREDFDYQLDVVKRRK